MDKVGAALTVIKIAVDGIVQLGDAFVELLTSVKNLFLEIYPPAKSIDISVSGMTVGFKALIGLFKTEEKIIRNIAASIQALADAIRAAKAAISGAQNPSGLNNPMLQGLGGGQGSGTGEPVPGGPLPGAVRTQKEVR